MNEIPDLPFEEILRHLSLADRLRSRRVSRRWRDSIDRLKVKRVFYSQSLKDAIIENGRLVSEPFVHNFIRSLKSPILLFDSYGPTVLSNLRHLRFCELNINEEWMIAFPQAIQSFARLQQLDIIRFNKEPTNLNLQWELDMPMLHTLQLDSFQRIEKITLNSLSLKTIRIRQCPSYLTLNIVNGESIDELLVDNLSHIPVTKLKALKCLHYTGRTAIHSSLLSTLEQLQMIYLNRDNVSAIFEQKERYNRVDLKVYACGLLMDRSNFPPFDAQIFTTLAANPPRLADTIPMYPKLEYSAIQNAIPMEVNVMRRLVDLNKVIVNGPVHDVEHFLFLLRTFQHIVRLEFVSAQSQELFDQLPENSGVQDLTIRSAPSDFQFLFRLKRVVHLILSCRSIDLFTLRMLFQAMPFISYFEFRFNGNEVTVQALNRKEFLLLMNENLTKFYSLSPLIQSIVENSRR